MDNPYNRTDTIVPQESLEGISTSIQDDNLVSQYGGAPRMYPTETLEMHNEPQVNQYGSIAPPKHRPFTFSKRKAMIVSVAITVTVTLLTAGSMLVLMKNGPKDQKDSSKGTAQQDVTIKDAEESKIPSELEGASESLLVNGDLVTRGSIKVSSGGFTTVIRSQDATANQTIILPNASGTICLDSNNCGYASTADITELSSAVSELQEQIGSLQAQIDGFEQVTPEAPVAGVETLNDQNGAVEIQGSLNRISVSTSGGIITLSTPQDLDANANVQFGNLTVSSTGLIRSNNLIQTSAGNNISINAGTDSILFTSGGRVFSLPTSGALSQTICTSGVSCATGGGSAVLLSQPTAQTDATPEASIFINDTGGGHLIRLQSGGVDKLAVTNSGDTTVGGSLTVSGLGSGVVKSTGGLLSVSAVNLGTEVTGTLPVSNGGTGATSLLSNGVLVGNGTSSINSVVAGSVGQCLISTAGAPSFQPCPGTGGIDSINAETGPILIVGTANQINVSTASGTLTLSTPQNINTTATPTFSGLTVSGLGSGPVRSAAGLLGTGNINLGSEVSGLLGVSLGGTGVSSTPSNGQLLIGNGVGYSLGTLTAGSGITITNGGGSITVSAIGGGTCATCANQALSNLSGVGINTSLLSGSSTIDLGSNAAPFRDLFLGGSSTNNFRFTGTASVARTINIPDADGTLAVSAIGPLSLNANGQLSLGTVGIANGGTGATNAGSARTNLGAAGSGNNSDITATTALNNITPSGALTIGATGQTLALQGNSATTLSAGTGANITTLGFVAPSGSNTISFPALSGTVCLSVGNCAPGGTAGGDLTGSFPNPTIAKLQNTNLNISGPTDGQVLIYNNATTRWENRSVTTDLTISGTGVATIANNAITTSKIADGNVTNIKLANSSLTVTAGNGLTGGGAVALGASTNLAVVYGSTANTAVQGNTAVTITAGTGLSGGSTITLGAGGSSTLNVTYGSAANTAVQGNTQLTCASGTGNLSGGGTVVTLGTGGTCSNITITNSPVFSGTLAVQGATATIGASGQQGNVVLYDGGAGASSHTGTVQVISSLGQNTTYILPDPIGSSATICLSTGNCAGSGGGITGSGTTGRLSKFSGTGTITDSTLSESGSTLTATGNVVIQGANSLALGTSSSLDGSVTFRTAAGGNTVSLQAPASNPASNLTFRLPSAYGSNGDCLTSNGSGVLTFSACTGGAGGGVTSIDGQTGVVNISNATGSGGVITIDDATTVAKGIASFSTTNFAVSSGAVSIKAGGVDSNELATNSVVTTKIADGNVTNAKLQNSSLSVVAGAGLANGGSVSLGGSTTLDIGAGSGITVNANDVAVDATVCRTTGNCAGVGGTGDVLQNGNSYTAAMTIGTNDNFNFNIETAGVTRFTITNAGVASFTGALSATSFSGDGSSLTNLNASNLGSGTVATGRLSGSYTGITGLGTVTAGIWQSSAIADAYLQDNITVSSAGLVDWTALSNYPAACVAGSAITQLGDSVTCTAFSAGLSAIGTIDSQTKSANGAVISGSNLVLQTADASNPGLVSATAQIFAGDKTFNNRLGIGTAPVYKLDVLTTSTAISGSSNIGSNFKLDVSPASAPVASTAYMGSYSSSSTNSANINVNVQLYGAYNVAQNAGNAGLGFAIGSQGVASNTSTGAIVYAVGVAGSVTSSGTGAISNAIALLAQGSLISAGSITNAYGVYIDTQSKAGVGTGYGVYQVGAADINSFDGKVGIGTSGAANTALDVQGGFTIRSASAPTVSPADQGRFYYDATSDTVKLSVNGGGYTDLCTTSTCAGSSGSGNYIQNQNSVDQTANFRISGVGQANTGILTPDLDTISPMALNIGTTNATSIVLNKHVIVASQQVLLLEGGNTLSRQGTAQPGMVYFDTDTQKLIVFSNGKWQADRSDAILVAASNSTQAEKDAADYVANGNTGAAADGDQLEINAALTAAAGKKVVLLPGTYVADATILIPNNTTLAGVGNGTVIELADLDVTDNLIENSDTSTGTGVVIRDVKINGRKDLNTAGTQYGIQLNQMGNGSGSTARQGGRVSNIVVINFRTDGIYLINSKNNVLSNNVAQNNSGAGFELDTSSDNNTVADNLAQANGTEGFILYSDRNNFTGNTAQSNTGKGFGFSTTTNNTFAANIAQSNGNDGFFADSDSFNTVTGNTSRGNTGSGFSFTGGSNNNTITGNTSQSNTVDGFDFYDDNNVITSNQASSNTGKGFMLFSSSFNTISGNTVQGNTTQGIYLDSSNNNNISHNTLTNNGGATTNNGINLLNSDTNTISGNTITDTSATTNNYAINIGNSNCDNTYVTGNTLGTGTINNLGTGTIFGGQVNSSTNYVIQPAGTVELMKNTNVTGTLTATTLASTVATGTAPLTVASTTLVTNLNADLLDGQTGSYYQNASNINAGTLGVANGGSGAGTFTQYGVLFGNGTSAFGVTGVGTNGQCLLANTGAAPTWGACTATNLQGTYNASSPATINLADTKDISFVATDTATDPSIIMKLNCTACATGATGNFQIQNNAGAALLSIAGNGTIQIGTASNGISLSGSGGSTTGSFTLSGTARNTKNLWLNAEYAGAVLDKDSDTSGPVNCSTNFNGTMTSVYTGDTTRTNFYNWVSNAASTNCYDIIVQVPVPSDFDGWNNQAAIQVYNSAGANSTSVYVQVYRTDGVVDSHFSSYVALSSNTTIGPAVLPVFDTTGYDPGGLMTIKIRMSSPNTTTNVRVGNILLNYFSKF